MESTLCRFLSLFVNPKWFIFNKMNSIFLKRKCASCLVIWNKSGKEYLLTSNGQLKFVNYDGQFQIREKFEIVQNRSKIKASYIYAFYRYYIKRYFLKFTKKQVKPLYFTQKISTLLKIWAHKKIILPICPTSLLPK